MAVTFRIITIGTLARNLLWGESADVRSPHSTTTLLEDGERRILVDPSLPPAILGAQFFERTGQQLDTVTYVFCTTLHPGSRRGLAGLDQAKWWCAEQELQWYAQRLATLMESTDRLDPEQTQEIEADLEIVRRFQPAPDQFTDQIGLYPLHGATPGSAGLLLTSPTQTVVLAGPAVPTGEHLLRGMIWEQSADHDAAMTSLQDVLEIADIVIPGFDNVVLSPQRWM